MANINYPEEPNFPDSCIIFKHSTRCSVSARAAAFVEESNPSLPIYWVNVIEKRPISNWIAEHYGVLHQSPQLIVVRDGSVVRVLNHFEINEEALTKLQ